MKTTVGTLSDKLKNGNKSKLDANTTIERLIPEDYLKLPFHIFLKDYPAFIVRKHGEIRQLILPGSADDEIVYDNGRTSVTKVDECDAFIVEFGFDFAIIASPYGTTPVKLENCLVGKTITGKMTDCFMIILYALIQSRYAKYSGTKLGWDPFGPANYFNSHRIPIDTWDNSDSNVTNARYIVKLNDNGALDKIFILMKDEHIDPLLYLAFSEKYPNSKFNLYGVATLDQNLNLVQFTCDKFDDDRKHLCINTTNEGDVIIESQSTLLLKSEMNSIILINKVRHKGIDQKITFPAELNKAGVIDFSRYSDKRISEDISVRLRAAAALAEAI